MPSIIELNGLISLRQFPGVDNVPTLEKSEYKEALMQQTYHVLLSTQRALLKSVTPRLRSVVVDLDNDRFIFHIHLYYDGKASDEEIGLWQRVITEARVGLDSQYALDSSVERLDCPKPIPFRGRCAYLRKE
jgi:hypothetical protein